MQAADCGTVVPADLLQKGAGKSYALDYRSSDSR
jgi:hypothetical protein